MSSPDVITHIPDREIDGMIFVLTGCDGSGCFVASKYDGDKHRAVCVDIYSDEVLFIGGLADIGVFHETYLHIASRPSHLT